VFLERRVQKLEARSSTGSVSWRLEDGSKVSFTNAEMFTDGYMALQFRTAAALAGDPLPPLEGVLEALAATSQEERERIALSQPWADWVADFERTLAYQANPDEDDVSLYRAPGFGVSY